MGCRSSSAAKAVSQPLGSRTISAACHDPATVELILDDGSTRRVGIVSVSLAYCLLVAQGDGAVFLDSRTREEYDREHLYSAWCLDALMKPTSSIPTDGLIAGETGTCNAHSIADPGTAAPSWEAALRGRCDHRYVIVCGRGGTAIENDLRSDQDVKLVLQLICRAGVRPKGPPMVLQGGVPAVALRGLDFCLRRAKEDKARPLPVCPAELLSPGWGGSRPPAVYLGSERSALLAASGDIEVAAVFRALRVGTVLVAGGDLGSSEAKKQLRKWTVVVAQASKESVGEDADVSLALDACAKIKRQSAVCFLCGSSARLAAALLLAEVLPVSTAQSAEDVDAFLRLRCPSAEMGNTARGAIAAVLAARQGGGPAITKNIVSGPSKSASMAPLGDAALHEDEVPATHVGKVCDRLLKRTPDEGHVALGTIRAAFSHILHKPTEPKFRRLKGNNVRVQREVLSHPEAIELLRIAGWVRDGDDFVLPEITPLQALRDILGMMPQAEDGGSWR